jgi:hypothetical protein
MFSKVKRPSLFLNELRKTALNGRKKKSARKRKRGIRGRGSERRRLAPRLRGRPTFSTSWRTVESVID